MATSPKHLDVDELCRDADRDEAFELLSNSRRRTVLYVLYQEGAQLSMSELVDRVASLESDTPVDDLDEERRQSMYISLYQTHLPKLDSYGLVEYDADERTVTLTPEARDAVIPSDRLDEGRWNRYYAIVLVLGVLTTLSALLVNAAEGWPIVTLVVLTMLGGVTVAHARSSRDVGDHGSYLSVGDLV